MRRDRRQGHWGWRLASGLLAATLAGVLSAPAPGPAPAPGAAAATEPEARPYNTALLMTSNAGALGDSVVTDGAVVIWADARGALYAYTLAGGQERRLLDGPARRSGLALGGGTLVWVERAAGGTTIRGLR
ncbi:MAG: hypothetical protein M3Q65_06930, partial [Chloroflexota bacterium]|nr:hypothetical protein [Chloroflexota bacterium]